ncbi:cadmium resistance transporter [Phormidium sp. CLA17]|uniref:cadmium resistance transporter n=1 Tax=Leptolyngbya sp. Cla-17 TaxID=2803751 RepID=UPI0014919DDF|nr:cadmium resistance transporter [Leptolyngbya sp. Cla-17]MBM0740454.1 cadmium resistance transporter [Leptolyngbya sp. Cla-17]
MNKIFLAVIEGGIAFAATNVDDFVILLLFFAQVNATFRPHHIVSGSYWGFAALIALSSVGFFGGLVVSSTWIGLLGILPIILGIKQLVQREQEDAQVQDVTNESFPRSNRHPLVVALTKLLHPQAYKVAAVTFANGGDNIGIYVPLFAASDAIALGVILSVFFLLKGAWCYTAYRSAQNSRIAYVLARYGRTVVPFLLVGLGLFILWKNGTFDLLIGE